MMIHKQWVNYSLTQPDGSGQGVDGSGHKKIMGRFKELMGRIIKNNDPRTMGQLYSNHHKHNNRANTTLDNGRVNYYGVSTNVRLILF